MVCFNVMAGAARIREHVDRGSGTVQYILDGEIFVENLSYDKSVGFRVNVDGNWKDIYTSYFRSLLTLGGNSVEAWKTKGTRRVVETNPYYHPDSAETRLSARSVLSRPRFGTVVLGQ